MRESSWTGPTFVRDINGEAVPMPICSRPQEWEELVISFVGRELSAAEQSRMIVLRDRNYPARTAADTILREATQCKTCGRLIADHAKHEAARCRFHQAAATARLLWSADRGLLSGTTVEDYESARSEAAKNAAVWLAAADTASQKQQAESALRRYS